MKKTLIALSVAALAAPFAATADVAVTTSGVVQIKVGGSDADDSELTVSAGDVRWGIAAESALNSGLTGFGSLRLDIDAIAGNPISDNVLVGVKGDFGSLSMGDVGLAAGGGVKAWDTHDMSPGSEGAIKFAKTIGSLDLSVGFSPAGNDDGMGASIGYSAGNLGLGLGFGSKGDDEAVVDLGASYAMGAATVSGYFQTQDEAEVMALQLDYAASDTVGLTVAMSTKTDVETKLKLAASKDLGSSMSLSGEIVSTASDDDAVDDLMEYSIKLSQSF